MCEQDMMAWPSKLIWDSDCVFCFLNTVMFSDIRDFCLATLAFYQINRCFLKHFLIFRPDNCTRRVSCWSKFPLWHLTVEKWTGLLLETNSDGNIPSHFATPITFGKTINKRGRNTYWQLETQSSLSVLTRELTSRLQSLWPFGYDSSLSCSKNQHSHSVKVVIISDQRQKLQHRQRIWGHFD